MFSFLLDQIPSYRITQFSSYKNEKNLQKTSALLKDLSEEDDRISQQIVELCEEMSKSSTEECTQRQEDRYSKKR